MARVIKPKGANLRRVTANALGLARRSGYPVQFRLEGVLLTVDSTSKPVNVRRVFRTTRLVYNTWSYPQERMRLALPGPSARPTTRA